MSNVKVEKIEVKSEPVKTSEIHVSDLKLPSVPVIKEFELHPLKQLDQENYAAIKAKYGSLSSTDVDQKSKNQRDSRFSLNPLLREPLSIEQEEKRVIEEKVRAQVDALAKVVSEKAQKVGYDVGFKAGHDEASKKFEIDGAEKLAKLDKLVAELENAKVEIFRANERYLIEMIFRIAKMITLRETTTDRDYLVRLSRELITKSGARENITIKINPEEAKTIEAIREGLMKAFGQLSNLNIEASSQVTRGGCQVETEWNAIDASIEKQLEAIHRALIGKQFEGSEGREDGAE